MVTARAPARALGQLDLQLRGLLDVVKGAPTFQPYQFNRPLDGIEQLEIIGAVRRTLPTLSPATRRMLDAVRLAITIQADPARGYHFRAFVNRAAIAAVLGKARLVPYDVEKLNRLVALYLLSADYHALPTMTVRGADGQELQYGAGGEFIYHIPPKIMYALIFIEDADAFSALNPQSEVKAAALHERTTKDATNYASAAAYLERIQQPAPMRASNPERRVAVDYEGTRMFVRERPARRGVFGQPAWVYVLLALLAVAVFAGTWAAMSLLTS